MEEVFALENKYPARPRFPKSTFGKFDTVITFKMLEFTFFSLSSKLKSKNLQVHPVGLGTYRDKDSHFPQHNLIMGNYASVKFPVIFEYESGYELCDLIDTGWPSLFLISDGMKILFKTNRLTGWKTFPVEVYSKSKERIFGYYGLSITGRCGPIDYTKSEMIEKRLIESGPLSKFYKGRFFDLETWDGSDFFLPQSNFGIVVTDKVASILLKNKISNLRLTDLKDMEVMI